MATSLHDGWRGARGIKIMNPPCETLTSLATRAGRPFNQHQIPVCALTATSPDLGCYQNVKSKEQESLMLSWGLQNFEVVALLHPPI